MTSHYGKSPSYAFIRDVSTTNIPSTEENVNTQNSIPENKADAEYMSAVESGDMETAQRLVDEAAKKAGYTVKAYQGTRNGDFTIFNRNHNYFTDSKETAQSYTSNSKIYEGYLRITNPYVIDAKGEGL